MPDNPSPEPSFNLWYEPWIDLECLDGSIERVGIGPALLEAHRYRAIVSHSPLEVAGIQRLLVAVLQDALNPQHLDDLANLWEQDCFPPGPIETFERYFATRFDLFSTDQPFLQSADLPRSPVKGDRIKPVTYLAPEFPSGSGVVHYRHALEDEQVFCPVCCARGLVMVPAFAISEGSRIKPSINGVPPIYLLPQGRTLYYALLASIILPSYQPAVREKDEDCPWWRGPNVVSRRTEVTSVGYVESLTFPARRVRLHPDVGPMICTRCGHPARLGVRTMVFDMGLSRPKDSPFWQDPFAAYLVREKEAPLPVRPTQGKAAWREFANFFLKVPPGMQRKGARPSLRPRVVDQLEELQDYGVPFDDARMDFRSIGMRTDMKAKIFEWVDSGYSVPLALLHSSTAGLDVDDALAFAEQCIDKTTEAFRRHFKTKSKKSKGMVKLQVELKESIWRELAAPFHKFISTLADAASQPADQQEALRREALQEWMNTCKEKALDRLEVLLDELGDDARTLRMRYSCLDEASRNLYNLLKKEATADDRTVS